MAKIRSSKKTTLEVINSQVYEELPRPYLGMSAVGHHCPRYLWLSFRWCFKDKFTARSYRIFEKGHREEAYIEAILAGVGIKTFSQQEEYVDGYGHMKGHSDGHCSGVIEAPKTEHLAEYKTMKNSRFNEAKKKGIVLSNPVYYAQAQCYMYHSHLTRCLFVCVNKDTDELYIERIKYNKTDAEFFLQKGRTIILSGVPDPCMYAPTWYLCKWCTAQNICHYSEKPLVTCRSCKHVDIYNEGRWFCNKIPNYINSKEQEVACDAYECIEGI